MMNFQCIISPQTRAFFACRRDNFSLIIHISSAFVKKAEREPAPRRKEKRAVKPTARSQMRRRIERAIRRSFHASRRNVTLTENRHTYLLRPADKESLPQRNVDRKPPHLSSLSRQIPYRQERAARDFSPGRGVRPQQSRRCFKGAQQRPGGKDPPGAADDAVFVCVTPYTSSQAALSVRLAFAMTASGSSSPKGLTSKLTVRGSPFLR